MDEYRLSEYRLWDYGFDYYAPQSFETEDGRRIQIGWMGMPDCEEYTNPHHKRRLAALLYIPQRNLCGRRKGASAPGQGAGGNGAADRRSAQEVPVQDPFIIGWIPGL